MSKKSWFLNRFLVLILGLSVLTLPAVAADDFASEADEWSSSDDKPRKKSKKKTKRSKKSKKEVEEDEGDSFAGADDDEFDDSSKKSRRKPKKKTKRSRKSKQEFDDDDAAFGESDDDDAFDSSSKKTRDKSKKKSKKSGAAATEQVNAAVVDRQLWSKMQSIMIKTVNFSGGSVSDYIRFFKEEAAKNGLEITMTYLPADKGDATIIAGDTKGAVPELSFPSVMLADVNLAEVLECSCRRAGGQYLVENNEIKIIHNTHYISRTYSIAKAELLVREDDDFVDMDDEEDLGDLLRDRGIIFLRGSKASFKNNDKQLVYVAPLRAHEAMAEYERQLVELREGMSEAATYFKKYCATLQKIEKTCKKLQGGSTKKIKSKLKPFFKQLEASCPDSMLEQMEYYVRINPQEKKKVRTLIEDAGDAIQPLIDVCYEYDDAEAAELAENLYAHIRRFE